MNKTSHLRKSTTVKTRRINKTHSVHAKAKTPGIPSKGVEVFKKKEVKLKKLNLPWYAYLIGSLVLLLILLLVVLFLVRPEPLSASPIQTEINPETKGVPASVTDVSQSSITIKIFNGWTIAEIDSSLAIRKLAKEGDFIQASVAVAENRGLPFLEGFFLAGDYTLNKDENFAFSLAELMAEAFMQAAKPFFTIVSESEMKLSDFAIIASMISAETKNEAEYKMISSIIHNRLEKNMPLGIDATTRYEIGDWTNELSQEVLDAKTPYNTRRKVGLPPTGICCPNAETLEAAICPEESDYYYYRHDKNSVIHYSQTYEQQLLSSQINP